VRDAQPGHGLACRGVVVVRGKEAQQGFGLRRVDDALARCAFQLFPVQVHPFDFPG